MSAAISCVRASRRVRVPRDRTVGARASSTAVLRVPALVVGGGPVGLYASSLLSSYGVPSVLCERSAIASAHPRAHLINTRSMELLRELGVEAEVREQTPPLDEWRHFRYGSSLLGEQIAAQDHMREALWTALEETSVCSMAHLSQPKLEAILRAEAQRRSPEGGGTLLFGYECAHFAQSESGVRATLRLAAPPDKAAVWPEGALGGGGTAPHEVLVEADHLLACDGAHSRVRRSLGLRLRGPPPLQHFKSVHFDAPGLAPLLRERGREAMLYFVFNRGAVCVLVAHNISEGQWVAQLPFFPGLQDGDELDHGACEAAIRACIGSAGAGEDAVPFQVRSIGSWAMSAKVLERLTLGRVHILGDAAHQFPPAGAFGANTGLQDAHNLCWKVAAVHDGQAPDSLLDTYDAERRPVALANARLAVHNYHRGLRVANALGLPSELPHVAAALGKEWRPTLSSAMGGAATAIGAGLTSTLVRTALGATAALGSGSAGGATSGQTARFGSSLIEIGRAAFIDVLGHGARHPLGRYRMRSAQRVIDSGAALPLLFPRHELGFVYAPDATDGELPHAPSASGTGGRGEPARSIEDETYVPTSAPGARLPHHWLESADGDAISSHDLVHARQGPRLPSATPPSMTLLVDSDGGEAWARGAVQLRPGGRGAQALRVVAVSTQAAGSAGAAAGPFDHVVLDGSGGWTEKRQVGRSGAILVRPDGHVSWRWEALKPSGDAKATDEAAKLLSAALTRALHAPA